MSKMTTTINNHPKYITHLHDRLQTRPIPLPHIGQPSGFSCPECPSTIHAPLIYHSPKTSSPYNINWKVQRSHFLFSIVQFLLTCCLILQCHSGTKQFHQVNKKGISQDHFRTLNIIQLVGEIQHLNSLQPTPSAPTSSTLGRILQPVDIFAATPIQQVIGQLCPGFNGQYAAGHRSSSTRNRNCTHILCKHVSFSRHNSETGKQF